MEKGRRIALQIGATCLLHLLLIGAAIGMMRHYYDAFFAVAGGAGTIYLIWLFRINRGPIPWSVIGVHAAGSVLQAALLWTGVIPPDAGFFTGLAAAFYVLFALPAYLLLVIVLDLIVLLVRRIRSRNRAGADSGTDSGVGAGTDEWLV